MLGMWVSGAEARLALALLCAVVLAHAHDKRAEMSPVPFTFAARYGRSPQRFITPRNDRWMMTTRYGKRSESFTMEEDSVSHEGARGEPQGERGARLRAPARTEGGGAGALALSCQYTGVLELYRCTHARTHTLTLARRSDEDPAPSQEQ